MSAKQRSQSDSLITLFSPFYDEIEATGTQRTFLFEGLGFRLTEMASPEHDGDDL